MYIYIELASQLGSRELEALLSASVTSEFCVRASDLFCVRASDVFERSAALPENFKLEHEANARTQNRHAHFTCFTSTKVQTLTPEELQPPPPLSTNVQILTSLLVQKYEY